jgi:antitoxin ParD1/3/4
MKPAGQMTLTLTPELEAFVRAEVKRGAFASSSEYVRTLVRERYRRETERAARLKSIEAALDRGLADAEAGRAVPAAEAFRRLREELDRADSEHTE